MGHPSVFFGLGCEEAAEGCDQLGSGERFLEVGDVIGRKVAHYADLLAGTGDDEDGEERGELAETMGQLDAAELGHDDVGNDKV